MDSKTYVLEAFKRLGNQASFHYADDSTKEWGVGQKAESAALTLFDDNPDLQEEFREIATGFLWSLNMRRPKQ